MNKKNPRTLEIHLPQTSKFLIFDSMDIQTSKIELAKLILSIENPTIIEKIKDLLKSESIDFAETLTEYEKEEIEMAIQLLNQGHKTSFDDFLKRVS
jgi:hypothetical protein